MTISTPIPCIPNPFHDSPRLAHPREPYEPELFFTTLVGARAEGGSVAGEVEVKELETSSGSVPYLPPFLLYTMWESISHLQGLVNSSSPLWLLGNGYRAFWGNWCWYNARHPDIPRHVLAPKVVCGWKEEVARGKARGAITGGDGKIEVEEMFREEGKSGGKVFLEKVKEAVAVGREGAGNEVSELARKAVKSLGGGKKGVQKGALGAEMWKKKMTYLVVLQIAGHYGFRDMEVVSSLDLLTVKPRVEEVGKGEEEEIGEAEGEEAGQEGEGREWVFRTVFGSLF